MAKEETAIVNEIMLHMSTLGCILWRNARGIMKDQAGNVVRYGVGPNGASDLIGFTMTEVTPEMIGNKLPILTTIEVKTPKGVVRPEQTKFIETILNYNGYAGVARSPEDAKKIIKK